MLGVDHSWDTEELLEQCAIARGDHNRNFGVGFFGWALEQKPHLLDVAIGQKPKFITISFLNPAPYATKVHAAGILLGSQVQSRRDAEVALAAGVDILIAQGTEAGGHTGDVSTMMMMQIALQMADVPVVVSGGIATGAGLAAVLAAGAAGAWIGTPFLLADEANVSDAARQRIINSDETQTVLTALFDKIQGYPWPERFRGRVLQNGLTREWIGRETEATNNPSVLEELSHAQSREDFNVANIYAGQAVGLRSAKCSARRIVEELGEDAERILHSSFRNLRTHDAN